MVQIRENISLRPYNTFGIDIPAQYFAVFRSVEDIKELLERTVSGNKGMRMILGGGSNILLTQPVEGWVLKNEITGIDIVKEDEHHVYVKAGAGENWHHFVQYCLKNNFAGVENLALIPGNVGASPMQNIGAYGVEIKDVFHELEALHI